MIGTKTPGSPLIHCVIVAGIMSSASSAAATDATAGTSSPMAPTISTTPTTIRIQVGNPRMAAAWSVSVSTPISFEMPVVAKTAARSTLRIQTTTASAPPAPPAPAAPAAPLRVRCSIMTSFCACLSI